MKIRKVSELTGLSKDTLRYYEKEGLIRPSKEGYSRDYSEEDVEMLSMIRKLRDTGLSIGEIRSLVELDDVIENPYEITENDRKVLTYCQELFSGKSEEFRERIRNIEDSIRLLDTFTDKISKALKEGRMKNEND